MCFVGSKEQSQGEGSFEYPQHMFCDRNEITRAAVDGIPSQIPSFLPLAFTLRSRSHENVAQYSLSLKLLRPTV